MQLKTGSKAYFDSANGMVPCYVIGVRVTNPVNHSFKVTAIVTANKAGYRKGEVIEYSNLSIVPREAVRRRKYQTIIKPFETVSDMPFQSEPFRLSYLSV